MKRYLLAALIMLLTACLSPSGDAPQTVEPTPTATLVPTAAYTPTPEPTSKPTITPTPTPEPMTMEMLQDMSDDEKFKLVENPNDYPMYASNVEDNIVILFAPDGPYAYDLLTGENKTMGKVNLRVFEKADGTGYVDILSFGPGEHKVGMGYFLKKYPPHPMRDVFEFEKFLRGHPYLMEDFIKFTSNTGIKYTFLGGFMKNRIVPLGYGRFNDPESQGKVIIWIVAQLPTGEYKIVAAEFDQNGRTVGNFLRDFGYIPHPSEP